MKTMIAALAAVMLGSSAMAAGPPPPQCADPAVKEALLSITGNRWFFLTLAMAEREDGLEDVHIKDLHSDRADVRWCEAPITPRGAGSLRIVTYTVEWINAAAGRFSVEAKGMRACVVTPTSFEPGQSCFNPNDEVRK